MIATLALGLALAVAQEEVIEPVPAFDPSEEGVLRFHVRGGALWTPSFDALTPLGRRGIERDTLVLAGTGVEMSWGPWVVGLDVEQGRSSDLTFLSGAMRVGVDVDLLCPHHPVPVRATLSAGPSFASLEAEDSRFGDFTPGWGAVARAVLSTPLGGATRLSVWTDVRHVRLEFDEDVLTGDEEFGSAVFGAGLSLEVRF